MRALETMLGAIEDSVASHRTGVDEFAVTEGLAYFI